MSRNIQAGHVGWSPDCKSKPSSTVPILIEVAAKKDLARLITENRKLKIKIRLLGRGGIVTEPNKKPKE